MALRGKYRLSFTAGGLLLAESLALAARFLEIGDWNSVQVWAVETNLLQARTLSSAKRICSELITRLSRLSNTELQRLVASHSDERRVWLWIAICRAYALIREFAVEVVHERYLAGTRDPLTLADYQEFLERKMVAGDELAKASSATRAKIRQKTFQLLQEVGLISKEKVVQGLALTDESMRSLPACDLEVFPIYVKGS